MGKSKQLALVIESKLMNTSLDVLRLIANPFQRRRRHSTCVRLSSTRWERWSGMSTLWRCSRSRRINSVLSGESPGCHWPSHIPLIHVCSGLEVQTEHLGYTRRYVIKKVSEYNSDSAVIDLGPTEEDFRPRSSSPRPTASRSSES